MGEARAAREEVRIAAGRSREDETRAVNRRLEDDERAVGRELAAEEKQTTRDVAALRLSIIRQLTEMEVGFARRQVAEREQLEAQYLNIRVTGNRMALEAMLADERKYAEEQAKLHGQAPPPGLERARLPGEGPALEPPGTVQWPSYTAWARSQAAMMAPVKEVKTSDDGLKEKMDRLIDLLKVLQGGGT
jgi:hypothetical protein